MLSKMKEQMTLNMGIQQNQASNDKFYLSEYTAARGDNGGEEEVKPIYFQ